MIVLLNVSQVTSHISMPASWYGCVSPLAVDFQTKITEHASVTILVFGLVVQVTVGEMLEVDLLSWRVIPTYNFY